MSCNPCANFSPTKSTPLCCLVTCCVLSITWACWQWTWVHHNIREEKKLILWFFTTLSRHLSLHHTLYSWPLTFHHLTRHSKKSSSLERLWRWPLNSFHLRQLWQASIMWTPPMTAALTQFGILAWKLDWSRLFMVMECAGPFLVNLKPSISSSASLCPAVCSSTNLTSQTFKPARSLLGKPFQKLEKLSSSSSSNSEWMWIVKASAAAFSTANVECGHECLMEAIDFSITEINKNCRGCSPPKQSTWMSVPLTMYIIQSLFISLNPNREWMNRWSLEGVGKKNETYSFSGVGYTL